MEFKINEDLSMDMQSANDVVYNEALFLMPYKKNNKEKIHLWHGGIVSYILMDFSSEEKFKDYPKYIKEHGQWVVSLDKGDITGTMKGSIDHDRALKILGYYPQRPISFFDVHNPHDIELSTAQEEINNTYRDIFKKTNESEIAEKLIRTYMIAVDHRKEAMKGHNDNLTIYYGEPNKIFLDELVKKFDQKDKKILEIKDSDRTK